MYVSDAVKIGVCLQSFRQHVFIRLVTFSVMLPGASYW